MTGAFGDPMIGDPAVVDIEPCSLTSIFAVSTEDVE